MGLSVNILTSGFLVTVLIFFVLMGYLFYMASKKLQAVRNENDSRRNNIDEVNSAYNSAKTAYILAFIAAGLSALLAVLYAGHETIISPSEYWHLALFVITYILLVISVIYAAIALDKIYQLGIEDRNGADSYLWAGLLMSVFAFMGLTASGTGRLGMNIVRKNATERVQAVESKINEHLPAIRDKVESTHDKVEATHNSVKTHLPAIRDKVETHLQDMHQSVANIEHATVPESCINETHAMSMGSPMMGSPMMGSPVNLSQPMNQPTSLSRMSPVSQMSNQMGSTQMGSNQMGSTQMNRGVGSMSLPQVVVPQQAGVPAQNPSCACQRQ